METGVRCHIHEGSLILPNLSRINSFPRIDTYLFKIYSNAIILGRKSKNKKHLNKRTEHYKQYDIFNYTNEQM